MQSDIAKIISEQLGVAESEVSHDKSFVEDLNADSLDLTELLMTIEERCGVEVPQEEAEKLTTVGDLMKYVDSHSKEIQH